MASSGGTAVGYGASATGAMASAFGPGATAGYDNSVAIGSGSVASAANTASFGTPGHERRLTNIAPAIYANDAVNYRQFSASIAASSAMATPTTPSAPGKTTFNVNTAFYNGEIGYGVGVAHRFDISPDVPVVVSGSFGASSNFNDQVGRVGLSFEF